MSILDKFFPRRAEVLKAATIFKMVSGYEPVFRTFGEEIYESMMVRSVIDARARHASKLKPEFLGSARPDLMTKLKKRPNPWDTWSQFLYRVSTILDCQNTCILVPIYNADFEQIGIYPVLTSETQILEYKEELWIRYRFSGGLRTAAAPLKDCAILRRFQYENDFFGSSNDALTPTMDLISIQDQGIKEAIKSTASYKFMARLANFSKLTDLKSEQESFTEATFGEEAKKKRGLLLFPNTYQDVKQIELKPWTPDKDQQAFIKANVCEYFGVSEEVLQNKTTGDSWSAFYEGAIEPFSVQLSEVLTAALFTEREQSFGAGVLFTANRLQYMNTRDKLSFVKDMTDRGLLMIDEAREVFNLSPLPDGQGQRFVARGEYYFIQEEGTNGNNQDSDSGASNSNPDKSTAS